MDSNQTSKPGKTKQKSILHFFASASATSSDSNENVIKDLKTCKYCDFKARHFGALKTHEHWCKAKQKDSRPKVGLFADFYFEFID